MKTSRCMTSLACLFVAAASFAAGCDNGETTNLRRKIIDLTDENTKLATENTQIRAALAEKDFQIATLQGLVGKKVELIYSAVGIRLGRYTGGVTLDNTPGDEAVRIYLDPFDRDGDVIKAVGDIRVQLYDLSLPPEKNLIAQKNWPAEQAAKEWMSSIVGNCYSLTCPINATAARKEITVRVEFTDYATGKTFTTQGICKILPTPASAPSTKATK